MAPNSEDDSSSEAEDCGVTGTGKYVTKLNTHDVLLGRGTGPNNNEGNVKFRVAVEGLKLAYVSTASRKAKNRIVRKTVESVKVKNGRFLSKLKKREIKMLGLPHNVVYEVATDAVAIEKTKQALRYVCYKKDPPQMSESLSKSKAKKEEQNLDEEDSLKKPLKRSSTSKYAGESLSSKRKRGDGSSRNLPQLDGSRISLCPTLPTIPGISSLRQVSSPMLTAGLAGPSMSTTSPSLLSLTSSDHFLHGSLLGSTSRANAYDAQLLASARSRMQSSHPFLTTPPFAASFLLRQPPLLPVASGSDSDRALLAAALQQHDTLRAAIQDRFLMLSRPPV
jgi:hypothetical protein